MRIAPFLCAVFLFAPPAGAQTVYKCKTAQGTVFSQTPCAPGALPVEVAGQRRRTAETMDPGDAPPGAADFDLDAQWLDDTNEVIAALGKPQAKYYESDAEYWLYAVACKVKDEGVRKCPELRVLVGRVGQVNWWREDEMRRNIAIARGFGDFVPKRRDAAKSFSMADASTTGASRAATTQKLGPPDYKRVFRGVEVWEYHKVRLSPDDPTTVTLFLEFEGDRVARAIGN